ncbi:MAG: succinate--CoA ligase subunit alpha [Rhodobacteraceae bacterium]|nr:succinate--CoA ligase subunit alpha [Paracoccaceae bacterium]
MILRRNHRILVFGITGRQATHWVGRMVKYGANVVGGVNPRKPGIRHVERKVWASAHDAAKDCRFEVALLFVPPLAARSAAVDAMEAGSNTVVCLTEHVPTRDVMYMIEAATANRASLVGPNTPGLVTPGETFAGIMPAFNPAIFQPGRVGVISRSGSLGTLACHYLTKHGFGVSAFLGVGGDPIVGTSMAEGLRFFAGHGTTEAIVLCGEIGGAMEEEVAECAEAAAKPIVAFVAGRSAPVGRRMGHAGAMVAGRSGTHASKVRALERHGIPVAQLPSELPALLYNVMSGRRSIESSMR